MRQALHAPPSLNKCDRRGDVMAVVCRRHVSGDFLRRELSEGAAAVSEAASYELSHLESAIVGQAMRGSIMGGMTAPIIFISALRAPRGGCAGSTARSARPWHAA